MADMVIILIIYKVIGPRILVPLGGIYKCTYIYKYEKKGEIVLTFGGHFSKRAYPFETPVGQAILRRMFFFVFIRQTRAAIATKNKLILVRPNDPVFC